MRSQAGLHGCHDFLGLGEHLRLLHDGGRLRPHGGLQGDYPRAKACLGEVCILVLLALASASRSSS